MNAPATFHAPELTDMQRAFCLHLLRGAKNQSEAARLAGFAHPAVEACRLMRHPGVVEYIARERMKLVEAEGGTIAYRTLVDCCDPKYPGNVRVSAAKVLAQMAGMIKADGIATDRKQLQEMSADELEDQLRKIDQALGAKAEAAKPIEGASVVVTVHNATERDTGSAATPQES